MTTKKDSTKGNPGSKPPSTFEERLAEGQKALERNVRARSRIDESRDDLIKARADSQSAFRWVQQQAEAREARAKELHDLHIKLLKQKVSSSMAPAGERIPEPGEVELAEAPKLHGDKSGQGLPAVDQQNQPVSGGGEGTLPSQAPAEESEGEAASPPMGFTHSSDYRSVNLEGRVFPLSTMQAAVVQVLHKNYSNGTPDVSGEGLIDAAGSSGRRLRDIFKSNMEAWKALIAKSKRKGAFRLNLPEVMSPAVHPENSADSH